MARDKFPIDEAEIVSLWLESVFYGIYLVTFFSCIRVLVWSPQRRVKKWSELNKPMSIATLLMCLFASLDIAFGLCHNLDAFVFYDGDPIKELDDASYWVNVMKMVDYVAMTFIGDLILVYRCWTIYGRTYVSTLLCIVPFLSLLAETACGIVAIYLETNLGSNSALLDEDRVTTWMIISMTAIPLATNVVATSLIVYRLWSVHRELRKSGFEGGSTSGLAMKVIIESGAIYTSSIVILTVLYLCHNNGMYPVSDAVVQIVGITFNLIIIRVGRGTAVTRYTLQTLTTRPFQAKRVDISTTMTPAEILHMPNMNVLGSQSCMDITTTTDNDSPESIWNTIEMRLQKSDTPVLPASTDSESNLGDLQGAAGPCHERKYPDAISAV